MKETSKLYTAYEQGELTREEFKTKLLETLFAKRRIYMPKIKSEDLMSEIFIYFIEHLDLIIDRYEKQKATFDTYISRYFNQISAWKIYAKESAWEKEEAKKFFMQEYDMEIHETYTMAETSLELNSTENSLTMEQIKEIAYRLTSSTKRDRMVLKEGTEFVYPIACIVLGLKACNTITDDLIEKIALISGINITEYQKMIETARNSMMSKTDRYNEACERRNYIYYSRKRCYIRKAALTGRYAKYIDNRGKYEAYDEKWKEILAKLEKISGKLVPSHKVVGELLGLTDKQVASIIRTAKNNIDNIKLKCYSAQHENISSDWKPKQKAGSLRAFPGTHRSNSKRRGH